MNDVTDDGPKVWKLDGELAVESGVELLEKLADPTGCWMGEEVLKVGWAEFEYDRDGMPKEDVHAKKVARAYFRHQYEGGVHVCDHHRDMVKQVCETGTYVPVPTPSANPMAKFAKLERIKKTPKKDAKPAEKKTS